MRPRVPDPPLRSLKSVVRLDDAAPSEEAAAKAADGGWLPGGASGAHT